MKARQIGFIDFLQHPATPDYNQLTDHVFDLEASSENPQGQVQLRKVIGDQNLVFMIMHFQAKTEIEFDLDKNPRRKYFFDGLKSQIHLSKDISTKKKITVLNQLGKNSLRFLISLNIASEENTLSGSKVEIHLGDLQTVENGQIVSLVKGPWVLVFDLDYQRLDYESYRIQRKVPIFQSGQIPLRYIYVSPISMTMEFYSNFRKNIFLTDVKLLTKSGKKISTRDHSAFIDESRHNFYLIKLHSEILDLEDLKSLEVMGREFNFRQRTEPLELR